MKLSSVTAYIWKNKHGYFMLELQAVAAMTAIITAVFYSDFIDAVQNIHKAVNYTQLYSVERYMLSDMEKDLGYESTRIILSRDYRGNTVIKAQSVYAGKQLMYTFENRGLYKTTQTLGTKGKNPLYIPGYNISEWQAERISERSLLLRFTLSKDTDTIICDKHIYCLNGIVEYES